MIVEFETYEVEGVGTVSLIADGPDGATYCAEPEPDGWCFEVWTPRGVLHAEKHFATFNEGAFDLCTVLKADGWTVDGEPPKLA